MQVFEAVQSRQAASYHRAGAWLSAAMLAFCGTALLVQNNQRGELLESAASKHADLNLLRNMLSEYENAVEKHPADLAAAGLPQEGIKGRSERQVDALKYYMWKHKNLLGKSEGAMRIAEDIATREADKAEVERAQLLKAKQSLKNRKVDTPLLIKHERDMFARIEVADNARLEALQSEITRLKDQQSKKLIPKLETLQLKASNELERVRVDQALALRRERKADAKEQHEAVKQAIRAAEHREELEQEEIMRLKIRSKEQRQKLAEVRGALAQEGKKVHRMQSALHREEREFRKQLLDAVTTRTPTTTPNTTASSEAPPTHAIKSDATAASRKERSLAGIEHQHT